MSRHETIQFAVSPRDIRLGARAVMGNSSEHLRAAERAGYERGVIEGERALSAQLLRQRTELFALQNGAITALQQAVPQVVRQTEDAMVALAFEIAQKLVADLPITREVVAANVREALEQVEDTTEFTVLLHPDDLEMLGADPAKILNAEVTGHKMRFTASHEVSRGGCVVQTRFGIIDTRRETKLARVAEALGVEFNANDHE
jgi:flagellar assembly protein FliH